MPLLTRSAAPAMGSQWARLRGASRRSGGQRHDGLACRRAATAAAGDACAAGETAPANACFAAANLGSWMPVLGRACQMTAVRSTDAARSIQVVVAVNGAVKGRGYGASRRPDLPRAHRPGWLRRGVNAAIKEPGQTCRLLVPRRRAAAWAGRSRQLVSFKCPGGHTNVRPRQGQRPVNAAGRFSTKWATPSLKFSVLTLAAI